MLKIAIALLLFCCALIAQPSPPVVILPGSPPGGAGGACADATNVGYLAPAGLLYTCQGSPGSRTWIAGGGGAAPLAIGNSVGSGTANSSLYVASGPVLGQYPQQTLPVATVSGVDCTGMSDSSVALNALTTTDHPGIIYDFRGCQQVRLDHAWIMNGLHSTTILLGEKSVLSASSLQGSTVIFGCGTTTGFVVSIRDSSYMLVKGGAIVARINSVCPMGSAFTGSLEFNAEGMGGSQNAVDSTFLTTDPQGGTITNYIGLAVNGTPNQEQYKFTRVSINCQSSLNSYGWEMNAGNADGAVFERGIINGCFHGLHQASVNVPNPSILYSDLTGNGNFTTFGAGGAVLYGPVNNYIGNVTAETTGILQVPNAGGTGGGYFANNNIGINDSTSVDTTKYMIDRGIGSVTLLGNNFVQVTGSALLNNTIVGSTGSPNYGDVVDLGGNIACANFNSHCFNLTNEVTLPQYVSNHFADGHMCLLSDANLFNSGGCNTGFGALPQSSSVGQAPNSVATASATMNWYVQVHTDATKLDRYVMQDITDDFANSTLVLNHVGPAGVSWNSALGIGQSISGMKTIATAIPLSLTVTACTAAVSPSSGGPTCPGGTGATTYSYQVSCLGGFGETTATSVVTINNGNATLSATNFNQLQFRPGLGCVSYKVYRTAGGATQGSLGITPIAPREGTYQNALWFIIFNDTGLAGDASSALTTSTADGSIAVPTTSAIRDGNGAALSVVYAPTENGAANAIACAAGCGPVLVAGLRVDVKLAHTLQAGANTFAYAGGGALAIKSHLNTANNIGTAYASGGIVPLVYDGTQWEDLSQ